MPWGAVESTDDGLSFRYGKRFGRDRSAQRKRTGAHPLATRAMARHRKEWRGTDAQAHLSAAATTVHDQGIDVHEFCPSNDSPNPFQVSERSALPLLIGGQENTDIIQLGAA
jgi:hypothetical protein